MAAPTPFPPIFTPESLLRLASGGRAPEVAEAAKEARRRELLPPEACARDLYRAAYVDMARQHRAEYVFKNELLRRLVFGVHSPQTTAFLMEHKVGEGRADAVLVNGHATAFEIKTEYDSFARAEHQVAEYARCFRFIEFVVAPQHEDAAVRSLPDHVGIRVLGRRLFLRRVREPRAYADGLDARTLYTSLHQAERAAVDRAFGIPPEDYSPPYSEWAERDARRLAVIDTCDRNSLALAYEQALRRRRPAVGPLDLLGHLDPCLTAVAFAGALARLTQRQRAALVRVLDEPLTGA